MSASSSFIKEIYYCVENHMNKISASWTIYKEESASEKSPFIAWFSSQQFYSLVTVKHIHNKINVKGITFPSFFEVHLKQREKNHLGGLTWLPILTTLPSISLTYPTFCPHSFSSGSLTATAPFSTAHWSIQSKNQSNQLIILIIHNVYGLTNN